MATAALGQLPIPSMLQEVPALRSGLSPPMAVLACVAMALGYVLVLYVPTVVLRLPPPKSLESFLLRRFTCALIFSVISVFSSAALLGIERYKDFSVLLGFYGIRKDHMWQAAVFPLLLTSLLYMGSLVSKFVLMLHAWRECRGSSCCELDSCQVFAAAVRSLLDHALTCVHNAVAWRNYVVAPFTEELVFRACMIPLLLCSGFQKLTIIFFGPVFFSLAHLNHFMELYYQQRYAFWKAFSIVGLQLGYTVVFGWYASFLFIRTGNLISAVVAHIFCNMMGLPVLLSSQTRGMASIAFVLGLACFSWLLFPASNPNLYNGSTESCACWHGYCSWP